jgi:hypothetical protein
MQSLVATTIDYAGTFAPASLPLPQMLERAAMYRKTSRTPWLMGKIALPLTDLLRIKGRALWDAGADGSAWNFSALGSSIQTLEEWKRTVEWDCREIRRFNEKFSKSSLPQRIQALEMKVPKDLSSDADAMARFNEVLQRVATLTQGTLDLYLETDFSGEKALSIADRLAVEISTFLESGSPLSIGLKLRYAGDPLPSFSSVAQAIALCATYGLQFKATQGLHHAMTTKEHGLGFLNLLLGINFCFVHGTAEFPLPRLTECLAELDAAAFEWSDASVGWRGFQMDLDAIETARRRHGACFGSCSLDEPEESLLELASLERKQ